MTVTERPGDTLPDRSDMYHADIIAILRECAHATVKVQLPGGRVHTVAAIPNETPVPQVARSLLIRSAPPGGLRI